MLTSIELGKCLQEARKRVRLSQTAVAHRLRITRQVVSAFESGKRSVTAGELQYLCNLFRVYPDDLLGFTKPANAEIDASLDFRMKEELAALTKHDQHEIEEFRKWIPLNTETYLTNWKSAFKKYGAIARNPFGSIHQLTETLRKEFQQEEPPINIYLLATQMGILVAPTHLDKPAAVVNRADERRKPASPPWILVSSTQPIQRQRYSIAHEIAHLLLHKEDIRVHLTYYRRSSDQREIDADTFAAELLMPRNLLQYSVQELKGKGAVEEVVFMISYVYQVSFLAIATRLYKLGLITRATYNYLCQVKPSTLDKGIRKSVRKKKFKPEQSLPEIEDELGSVQKMWMYNQYGVRRLQEIAYTRYIGKETQGGVNPTALYALDPPSRVYESVAEWVAEKYPMDKAASPC
jgi:Zn-dependent peptidase ImmA (M78 family)/DNA-binding XRE family transcriptional regulator